MSMEEHVVDQLFPGPYPLQNWENSPPIDGALDTQIDGQLNPGPSLDNSHGSNAVYQSFQHHITDALEGGVDDEPLYVNAKQYFRILKRRVARARLDEVHRLSRQRKVRVFFFPFLLVTDGWFSLISTSRATSMRCDVHGDLGAVF